MLVLEEERAPKLAGLYRVSVKRVLTHVSGQAPNPMLAAAKAADGKPSYRPPPTLSRNCNKAMADMGMLAAMGISGFGKKPKLRQLDPKRFEKNKREETVRHSSDTLR